MVNYPDGRFAVQFRGTSLPFRMFDKVQTVQPGAIVDNKRLSSVLAMVQARQAEYPPNSRRGHVALSAAAEQSGGTRVAIEGPCITHHDGFNHALIASRLIARHVQCADPARWPQGLRCAHRLTPASALDPAAPDPRSAMMPYAAGLSAACSDISIGERL